MLLLMAALVAGPIHDSATPPAADELRATFIGNMAFHITDGRVAILTDFPYQSGAFGYMEWSKALVPQGPAPLCLITHSHQDHFAPRLAREFCGAILGPKDVTTGSGVTAVEPKDDVQWEGIRILRLATPHAGLEHYSFLVEWGGRRLYFTGDTEDTDALLAARGVDVAFVSPWLLTAAQGKGRTIDARQVVAYHHKTGEVVTDVQGRLVPRQGDVLSLGSGSTPVRVIQAGPATIPVTVDEFERRLREADENLMTPAGRAYFDGFTKLFFKVYPSTFSECWQQTGETESPPSFDMVLDLGSDGRVQEAMVQPETKLTACILDRMKKETFPSPPSAAFRVAVLMRITRP